MDTQSSTSCTPSPHVQPSDADGSSSACIPKSEYVFESSKFSSNVGRMMSEVQKELGKLPNPSSLNGAQYRAAQAAFSRQFFETWHEEAPECLRQPSNENDNICTHTRDRYISALEPAERFFIPSTIPNPTIDTKFPKEHLKQAKQDWITYIQKTFPSPPGSGSPDTQETCSSSTPQLSSKRGMTWCADLEEFKQTIMSHQYTCKRVQDEVKKLQTELGRMQDPRELLCQQDKDEGERKYEGARAAFCEIFEEAFPDEETPSYFKHPGKVTTCPKTPRDYGDSLSAIIAFKHPYKHGADDFDRAEMEQVKEDYKNFGKSMFGGTCPASNPAGDTKASCGRDTKAHSSDGGEGRGSVFSQQNWNTKAHSSDGGEGWRSVPSHQNWNTKAHSSDGGEGWGSVLSQQNWKKTALCLGAVALTHVLWKTLGHARRTLLSGK